MTIERDTVIWDDGAHTFRLHAVSKEEQYRYLAGKPCVTFGVSYENARFKGYDRFTLFDLGYTQLLCDVEKARTTLSGTFRIWDMGADTDGYVDFTVDRRGVLISGQLGLSISDHSLKFSFKGDQTILALLSDCLAVEESQGRKPDELSTAGKDLCL